MTEIELKALIPSFLLHSEIYSVVITDLEGRYIFFTNEVFKKRFAFLAEDFIGKPFDITIHPEDVEKCNQVAYQCIANPDKTFRIQVRKSTPENDFYWTQWEFSLFKDPNQNPIGIFCLGYDVSREKKAQTELRQSEIMLRALYDSSNEALTLIDTNYKTLYNNKLAKQITKNIFGREAKIGDYSLDFYVPELREEFANYYQRVLQGETITVEKEYQGFWWRFNLYPVYDNENKIFGIATNLKDITRRKQQDLALYEAQQRLNRVIEAIPHPLLIVDAETMQITYVNAEFESVFGYTEQEVIGKEVDFLLPERFRAKHRFLQEEYLKEGHLIKNMGRYLPALIKNGIEIYTDASLNTFVANGKKYVIVILTDVTEIKKQQDKILEQNKALQQIAWQQSHEVRRPVANILGLCELLRDYKDEPEEIRDKYLEYMFKATQELDKVIHKIVEKVNEI
jgi:PAS domain S-box-containing protein